MSDYIRLFESLLKRVLNSMACAGISLMTRAEPCERLLRPSKKSR